jgi:hypothetical protein
MIRTQTARSCRLPTERRRSHSRGSLRIVSGLAENTNSIFCDSLQSPRQQMDVWFCREQEPMPRGLPCELRILSLYTCALSRARPEHPCFHLTMTYMDVGNPETILALAACSYLLELPRKTVIFGKFKRAELLQIHSLRRKPWTSERKCVTTPTP